MTSRVIRSTLLTLLSGVLVALGVSAGPAAASPQPLHACPYEYLCVHVYSVWEGTYAWKNWSACTTHDLGTDYVATWYINNQTRDTRALFTWDDSPGGGTPGDWWYTPYPYSKGRPPHHAAAESITVCA